MMTEIYKTINKLNPAFMWDLLKAKDLQYEFRTHNLLTLPSTKTKTYGLRSFTYRESILWNYLPDSIKGSKSLQIYKKSIRLWKGAECKCKFCI